MALNLLQTAISPENSVDPQNTDAVIQAALQDTQGNILKSNGRNNFHYLFVRFTAGPDQAGPWLATMAATYVTSAWTQYQGAQQHRQTGADAGLFVNLCLSAHAYAALGLTGAMPDDTSFIAGAKAAVGRLNDPPVEQWDAGYQGDIDALVMVADDDAQRLAQAVTDITSSLTGVGEIVVDETGAAMRVDRNGQVSPDHGQVREHFGFADGVSQPLFFDSDIQRALKQSGGFDDYDPSAPLGLALLKDPGGSENGYGTYFVYRKLAQDVAGFHGDIKNAAAALAAQAGRPATPADVELAGAYTVGRFPDGTPVVTQDVPGGRTGPNNFNYADDVDGVKCPFHAHIRKANPRGDKLQQFGEPATHDRMHRIVRRGVSYGPITLDPPPDADVGLLFVSAQSSIVSQFEFIQTQWANFDDFLRFGTGLDPVIGQAPDQKPTVPQQWPREYGRFNQLSFSGPNPPSEVSPYVPYQFAEWVTLRGAEYFFVPSLSFLATATSLAAAGKDQ